MGTEAKQPQFRGTAPHFVVTDLETSVGYFHEALGFDMPRLWGDPPRFAMPSRDGFIFMLQQAELCSNATRSPDRGEMWDAYVWVNDCDGLFAEFQGNGAIIAYEPCIREAYDMKEFAVRDPDGHIIAFGQHHESYEERVCTQPLLRSPVRRKPLVNTRSTSSFPPCRKFVRRP